MRCTVPGDWVRKSLNGVSEGPRVGTSRASMRCCAKLPRITGEKANRMRFTMLTLQSPIPRSADRPGNNPEEWNHDSPLSLLDVECLARVTSIDS